MSVLRGGASDEEFKQTLRQRIGSKTERLFHGASGVKLNDLKNLVASASANKRKKGERLYYVIDADAELRPHHAEILATVPDGADDRAIKNAWRSQRDQLLSLFRANFQAASEFRSGQLVN
ncbi:MAG: hypothetical protein KF835_11595 [Xanthobacteraceae bacterium]|nr:hypothetical protein [Xanthobacteraceae bacterium]